MKVNVTEHPIYEPTITVENHPKPQTREEFVRKWVDHAAELKYLGIDVTAQVGIAAHARFNQIHTRQRIDAIDAKAQALHPDADYRDMISDELHLDPTRTDDEIAHLVATRYAHP